MLSDDELKGARVVADILFAANQYEWTKEDFASGFTDKKLTGALAAAALTYPMLLDEVSALRTERDKLACIVRELAESGPPSCLTYSDYCIFCDDKAPEHKPTCLWRRAKESSDAE